MPNILTIYDIGSEDRQPYIVAELLEGENLRERLRRGPLATKKAVEMASAVADALAATHARNIVHRDLKPENLFVTRDGRLKILDFGVAKRTAPDPSQPGGASTVVINTEGGMAVGTLGYMAPEQMRGTTADSRSDIFALGAILHEMISGTPAFRQDSRIATVNAVLEADPPELSESIPPGVRRIIRRCVEKDPDNRFQSARDLAFALGSLSETATAMRGLASPRSRFPQVDARLAFALTAIAAIVSGLIAWQWPRPAQLTAPAVRRFPVQSPPGRSLFGLAISPDGRHVVQTMRTSPAPVHDQLTLRSLDQIDVRDLPGTERGGEPFFSPDGRWVAFEADGKLKKLPLGGGPVVAICDVRDFLQGSWGASGEIIIAQREQPLHIVSAEGGVPRPLTSLDRTSGELDHHAPHFLPGGKAFLFTIHAGFEVFRVAVRSLETGEQKTLADDGFDARFVASGHVVFGRGDRLHAIPFERMRLARAGQEVALVEPITTFTEDGRALFDVGSDGTLMYVAGPPHVDRSLVWIDRSSSHVEPLPAPPRGYEFPDLSPDGKRLVVQVSEGSRSDIWIYELETGSLSGMTGDGMSSKPIWSADGKHITYAARRQSERHIFWQPINGGAAPESLISSRYNVWPAAWTTGRDELIFVEDRELGGLPDLKKLTVATRAVTSLLDTAQPASMPALSPDGRWLAYVIPDDGRRQILLRPLVGGAPRRITEDGGAEPRWSGDGRELFFRRQGELNRVPIQTRPQLVVGKAQTLLKESSRTRVFGPQNYDVTADGSRFLFTRDVNQQTIPQSLVIVENWAQELARRVPVGP